MKEFRDPATQARVWQVTDGEAISHPTYFLQSSFLPEDRGLIYTSYRSGAAQLYALDFASGETRQLTFGEGIHPFSGAIHPNGRDIVFTRAGGLHTLERTICEFPGASVGECSISADGEWLVAAAKRDTQSGLICGRFDGSGWHFVPFPRTVIHPQFHPVETEWIEFSGDPAPRMHRVRRDGTGMECLYEHGNDEFVVHETFLGASGDIVFTVWPFRLMRMDWTTREIRNIADFNAWHIAPNRAGTQVLCDTNHPDRGIHVIDVATGAARLVCRSEASNGGSQWRTSRYAMPEDFATARSRALASGVLSWMEAGTDTVYGPQWTHPHPSWSRDEKRIAFASDRTGVTQVYIAEAD